MKFAVAIYVTTSTKTEVENSVKLSILEASSAEEALGKGINAVYKNYGSHQIGPHSVRVIQKDG